MQHRPKHLTRQFTNRTNFKRCRCNKSPVLTFASQSGLIRPARLSAHRLNMCQQSRLRFGVNHRPNIGFKARRISHAQLVHGTLQHRNHAIGDIILQIQDPQSRTALTGAIKSRGHDIGHHLFGQGRTINNHGVHAAGFGNQRNIFIPFSQRAMNDFCDFSRTRKDHACNPRIGNQGRAHHFATTG